VDAGSVDRDPTRKQAAGRRTAALRRRSQNEGRIHSVSENPIQLSIATLENESQDASA